MFLAMEYMPLGDLEQNLQEIENSPTHEGPAIPEEEVQEITRQILEGLNIMHAEGFAHRDLKPQNIFVVQKLPQWWVKLGDFGLSKQRTEDTAFRTQAGTRQYMAPELFYYVPDLESETSEYTSAVDLWGLGCIVYRIITGAVPFPSLLSLKNYCQDPSKMPLCIPPTMEKAVKFVGELLQPHPGRRPLASSASKSDWLQQSKFHFMLNSNMRMYLNRLAEHKPNINLPSMDTLSSMEISSSQNKYNTESHKGLQSYFSMPGKGDPPANLFNQGPTSEPIPDVTQRVLPRPKTNFIPPISSSMTNSDNTIRQKTMVNNPPRFERSSLASNSSELPIRKPVPRSTSNLTGTQFSPQSRSFYDSPGGVNDKVKAWQNDVVAKKETPMMEQNEDELEDRKLRDDRFLAGEKRLKDLEEKLRKEIEAKENELLAREKHLLEMQAKLNTEAEPPSDPDSHGRSIDTKEASVLSNSARQMRGSSQLNISERYLSSDVQARTRAQAIPAEDNSKKGGLFSELVRVSTKTFTISIK